MLVRPDSAEPTWVVLRTKPKQESAVLQALQARDLPAYCPRILEARTHLRAPHVPVPLFPSYVFAHVSLKAHFAAVHYCQGAHGILRFGEDVAAVEEAFIALLRAKEADRGFLEIGRIRRRPRAGERARVVKGPLAGLEGIVERYLPAKDRVRLLLQLVGRTQRAEVDGRAVQFFQSPGE